MALAPEKMTRPTLTVGGYCVGRRVESVPQCGELRRGDAQCGFRPLCRIARTHRCTGAENQGVEKLDALVVEATRRIGHHGRDGFWCCRAPSPCRPKRLWTKPGFDDIVIHELTPEAIEIALNQSVKLAKRMGLPTRILKCGRIS